MTDKGAKMIADAINNLANAITPLGAAPATDAQGGHVASVTEGLIGATAALTAIARSIEDVRLK